MGACMHACVCVCVCVCVCICLTGSTGRLRRLRCRVHLDGVGRGDAGRRRGSRAPHPHSAQTNADRHVIDLLGVVSSPRIPLRRARYHMLWRVPMMMACAACRHRRHAGILRQSWRHRWHVARLPSPYQGATLEQDMLSLLYCLCSFSMFSSRRTCPITCTQDGSAAAAHRMQLLVAHLVRASLSRFPLIEGRRVRGLSHGRARARVWQADTPGASLQPSLTANPGFISPEP